MATLVTSTTPRKSVGGQHTTGRRQFGSPTCGAACGKISDRDDQQPTVGRARPPIDQPAGSVRAPAAARLDGMTTETLVLPSVAPSTPLPQDRNWFRQLAVDTAYTLVAFPLAIAAFVVIVTGLALGAGLLIVWV